MGVLQRNGPGLEVDLFELHLLVGPVVEPEPVEPGIRLAEPTPEPVTVEHEDPVRVGCPHMPTLLMMADAGSHLGQRPVWPAGDGESFAVLEQRQRVLRLSPVSAATIGKPGDRVRHLLRELDPNDVCPGIGSQTRAERRIGHGLPAEQGHSSG